MVTGAGGSIGQGLCRQVCRYSPDVVLLVERAESPLYEIDLELRSEFPMIRIVPLLADVRDCREMTRIFESFCPDTIFHAAAYKHVPMLENLPWKAVDNNIAGTGPAVQVRPVCFRLHGQGCEPGECHGCQQTDCRNHRSEPE